MKTALFCILASFAVAGCAQVKVTRVDPDCPEKAEGIRYSLPKPIIRAVGDGDGSLTVSVLYFPDPDNTYAIDVGTAMAADTVSTQVQGGMLQSFAWKSDTTAVASEAVKASGQVSVSALDAYSTAHAANLTAVTTAQTAFDSADEAVRIDEAKITLLKSQTKPDDAAILTAQTTLVSDQEKLKTAQTKLSEAKALQTAPTPAAVTPSASGNGLSMDSDLTVTGATLLDDAIVIHGKQVPDHVYGPAFYALNERTFTRKIGDIEKQIPTVILAPIFFNTNPQKPVEAQPKGVSSVIPVPAETLGTVHDQKRDGIPSGIFGQAPIQLPSGPDGVGTSTSQPGASSPSAPPPPPPLPVVATPVHPNGAQGGAFSAVQLDLSTNAPLPKPPAGAKAPTILPTGTVAVTLDHNGDGLVVLTASDSIKNPIITIASLNKVSLNESDYPAVSGNSATAIFINMHGMKPGLYDLTISYSWQKDGADTTDTASIKIRVY